MAEKCPKCGSEKTSLVGTNPYAYECDKGHVFIKAKKVLTDE
jgi:hypothetical protein